MVYIGLDVGGMSIKGLAVTKDGTILAEDKIETGVGNGDDAVVENMETLCHRLIAKANAGDDYAVGAGCPGVIDSKNGVVQFAGNLRLHNYPLAERLSERLHKPVKLVNDANAAALGEARFGASKEYQNSILVTLGTGVGGGIIIDGQLFEGSHSAGAEIGHMVIERFSRYYCTCGRRGCFEVFSSATALMRKTKELMRENSDSAMWESYTLETVSGKTPFEYAECDQTAREVVEWYIGYLACGLTNLANIFRPDIILLGGGVSAEGEKLTVPLQKKMDAKMIGGSEYAPVKIGIASLGNRAGAYGAAALHM